MNNYHKSNEEYDVVQQEVVEETDDGFFVDFDKLQAQNPDCIGWIRFENLDISYPIMKGTDNEYYLHHTINGSYLYAGKHLYELSERKRFFRYEYVYFRT